MPRDEYDDSGEQDDDYDDYDDDEYGGGASKPKPKARKGYGDDDEDLPDDPDFMAGAHEGVGDIELGAYPRAQAPSTEKKVNLTEAIFGIENAEENLGEDFEDTPWLPPSIEKALEFKQAHIFRGGKAHLRTVNITGVTDLGVGTPLYFQFVKSMSIAFFFMMLLSLPVLVFCYFGSRVPSSEQDSMGLYKFTIGNIGYDPASATYANQSTCTSPNPYNETCIHVMNQEFTVSEVSALVTVTEVLQVLIFLVAVVHLHRRAQNFRKKIERKSCAVSDYSIIVKDVPPDTTIEQLIAHFSNLYGLDKMDWAGRPPVKAAVPVSIISNSRNPVYQGTWIAECTLHKKIGRFITAFKDKQELMEDIYRYRAQMKMFADNTAHMKGPNPSRYARAEKRMCAAGAALDLYTENLTKKRGFKLRNEKIAVTDTPAPISKANSANNTSTSSVNGSAPPAVEKADSGIDADVVAAFVVFQYPESGARCIEDYAKFSHFPYNLVYPHALKFRGHRIRVHRAPEPDEIVWEHLEVSSLVKYLKRVRTNIATALLVIICFAIVVQAAVYKQKFTTAVPKVSLCSNEIPALYAPGNNTYPDSTSSFELTLPPLASRLALDIACSNVIPKSFYAIYTHGGNFSDPVASYAMSACSAHGLCPLYGESVQCPCISTSSKQQCDTLACQVSDKAGHQCDHFQAYVIGGCMCLDELNSLLSSGVSTSTLSKIRDAAQNSQCSSFLINYSLASGLTYVAMITAVVVNYVLKRWLKFLTRTESHATIDSEQGSMMYKIFVAIYFNLAIVVLIAFGRSHAIAKAIKPTHIFDGTFDDFSVSW